MRESRGAAGTDLQPGSSSGAPAHAVGKRTAVEAIQLAGAPGAAAPADPAVVAAPALEAEADRPGELAAQGLSAGAGSTAAGVTGGGAIQRKTPTDPPGPAPEPPAGQVAQAHSFAVPPIPDLSMIPDAVNR